VQQLRFVEERFRIEGGSSQLVSPLSAFSPNTDRVLSEKQLRSMQSFLRCRTHARRGFVSRRSACRIAAQHTALLEGEAPAAPQKQLSAPTPTGLSDDALRALLERVR